MSPREGRVRAATALLVVVASLLAFLFGLLLDLERARAGSDRRGVVGRGPAVVRADPAGGRRPAGVHRPLPGSIN